MIGVKEIRRQMISHAATLGVFDEVLGHEPKSSLAGLWCGFWIVSAGPVRSSGLASVSAQVTIMARVAKSMLSEPQDSIDDDVFGAADQLMAAYSGAFTLGGLVRQVDLFGSQTPGLALTTGYVNQDGKVYRVADITVPMLVNDVWTEVS